MGITNPKRTLNSVFCPPPSLLVPKCLNPKSTFVVQAFDLGTGTDSSSTASATVHVTILDANDNLPVMNPATLPKSYNRVVTENAVLNAYKMEEDHVPIV